METMLPLAIMNQRFACPTCNAPLEHDGHATSARCEYCGSVVIVPEAMRSTASTPSAPARSPVPREVVQHKQQAINDIMELVRAGRQDEAIQLYHETFKVSLKEAKRTVAQLVASQKKDDGQGASLTERLSGLFGGLFRAQD